MASFTKGGGEYAPFGKNNFLRSTQPGSYLTDPYTASWEDWPVEMIDGHPQKILQPGEVIAKLTSGPNAGKVVPFQALASGGTSDGRDTLAAVVGIAMTHAPVTLNDRDTDIAVVYQASCRQAWCTERNDAGGRVVLTNTTADALRGKKDLQIIFPR